MANEGATRLPGLDGVRAIAVLAVLFFHRNIFPLGWVGVQLFFVLSGFLISRILVKTRNRGAGRYFIDFYGRRTLRIFPLYYASLLALWVVSCLVLVSESPALRQALPYALTYTYNIWCVSDSAVTAKLIVHFWSLCVEEQIYLVWPLLIWLCPERHLRHTFAALVVAGPVVRLGSFWFLSRPELNVDNPAGALYSLVTTHVDAFALGGFFALRPSKSPLKGLGYSLLAILGAGVVVLVQARGTLPLKSIGYQLPLASSYGYVWGYSLLNLGAAYLIQAVAQEKFAPRLFGNRWLNHVGLVSYGVYVFHYPLQTLIDYWAPGWPLVVRIGAQLVATIALSTVSFHFFEGPISRLKDVWFPQKVVAGKVPLEGAAA